MRRSVAGLACAGFAPLIRIGHAAGEINVTTLADDLWLLTGGGGNVLARSTADGQVIVDSGAAEFSTDLIATLGELPGERIAGLFNTHWHPEQVGANDAIGQTGAAIFAHDKTRQRLAAGYYLRDEDRYEPPVPAAGIPTETIFDQGQVRFGATDVDYGYLIEAHTDGDAYIRFPDIDVIAVGDVLAPDRDPVFDWFGGGWLGGRLDSIKLLLESSDARTRFVPAYGPVVGRAEVVAEQALYLELFDLFVEHIRLGQSARDMIDLGLHEGLSREFSDPFRLFYDLHKGFWAHENKLMHDIV
ncbi:MAG TPA: MBL fold metallo-hydrolase [Gammaproteobacteria bacterium]|nr:MBL fold metallo-hydrolase [Gammaproteobacteria bacterium]